MGDFAIIDTASSSSSSSKGCFVVCLPLSHIHLHPPLSGRLLHSQVQSQSSRGASIKAQLDSGHTIDEGTLVALISERLAEKDCVQHGWVLDGFPRTQAEARALTMALSRNPGQSPDVVVLLSCTDDEVEMVSVRHCAVLKQNKQKKKDIIMMMMMMMTMMMMMMMMMAIRS